MPFPNDEALLMREMALRGQILEAYRLLWNARRNTRVRLAALLEGLRTTLEQSRAGEIPPTMLDMLLSEDWVKVHQELLAPYPEVSKDEAVEALGEILKDESVESLARRLNFWQRNYRDPSPPLQLVKE